MAGGLPDDGKTMTDERRSAKQNCVASPTLRLAHDTLAELRVLSGFRAHGIGSPPAAPAQSGQRIRVNALMLRGVGRDILYPIRRPYV